jgi:dTDP-4-amino-4,6-dideoxygalactose transaminase
VLTAKIATQAKNLMKFNKSFTKQPTLPPETLNAAQRVLSSADLHRYQAGNEDQSEVAKLEAEYAIWQGAEYCLALASCGQAIQLALRSCGVTSGAKVMTNSFTLAPVPGAIRAVGAEPVLIEITKDLTLDLDDLMARAERSKAQVLLLSHMRGHLVDMDELEARAAAMDLTVIEDCAHTMGATWNGKRSGNFGKIGCFSTQSYKHLNSGEGGLMTTNDPNVMAQAIIMSGSYMNYTKHGAAPDERFFDYAKFDCANMSARMDNLRASILRPQLAQLDTTVENWNKRCRVVATGLAEAAQVELPRQSNSAQRVGSSLQFRVPSFDRDACIDLMARAAECGVNIQWFGDNKPVGFTSNHKQWRYISPHDLPQTDTVLATLFDMRIPLTFDIDDCKLVAEILRAAIHDVASTKVL